MAEFNWARAFDLGARVVENVTAGSAVRRDLDLLRLAGKNVLLAAGFPVVEAIPRWTQGGTYLERAERVLAHPAVRTWLVAWAEMPRPLRARPKGVS